MKKRGFRKKLKRKKGKEKGKKCTKTIKIAAFLVINSKKKS